jgi:uncharacterized protein UPF0149
MDPPEWICPLLGIGIDAFNHGGTPEFAAISAVAVRHNAIVETLTNAPKTFEPIFVRKPGKDIDAGPWCEGFYAAMKLRLSAWAPLRNLADINHRSCSTASTIRGAQWSARPGRGRKPNSSAEQPTFRPSSKKCVSIGCRHASRPDRSQRADVEARTLTIKVTWLTLRPDDAGQAGAQARRSRPQGARQLSDGLIAKSKNDKGGWRHASGSVFSQSSTLSVERATVRQKKTHATSFDTLRFKRRTSTSPAVCAYPCCGRD